MLKRLLKVDDQDVEAYPVSKRKKPAVSLSRSRSRGIIPLASQQSQSLQQSQSAAVKLEDTLTEPYLEQKMPFIKTEAVELEDAFSTGSSMLLRQEGYKKDVLSDIKNETVERLGFIMVQKEEPSLVKQEFTNMKTEDKFDSSKISSLLNTSTRDSESLLKSKEPVEADSQPDTDNSESYVCFICNKDLTHIKFTFFRQKHIDQCLNNMDKTPSIKEEQVTGTEFCTCCFCQKDMSKFKPNQRLVHLNRCLDEQASVMSDIDTTTAAEAAEKEDTFAGQTNSFMQTLEICPVCHEVSPMREKTVRQKLLHTKHCAKQHKMDANTLIMKFQWIRWGHVPTITERVTAVDNIPETNATSTSAVKVPPPPPQHELKAYIPSAAYTANDTSHMPDDDFDDTVIIHKQARPTLKQLKLMDKADQDFQTVLAISRSLHQRDKSKHQRKKQGIRPADERDWNAANIWSMEESKKRAIEKLDMLLFPPDQEWQALKQAEREKSHVLLSTSRLMVPGTIASMNNFYWNLASNRDDNWDKINSLIFKSQFMQKETLK